MTTQGARGGLVGDVRDLLQDAAVTFRGTRHEETVRRLADRLDGPLRVAIAGKVKAGKSTLLNALVGERVAATDASECTRVVTWYSDGYGYRAWLQPHGGEEVQVPFRREGGETSVDLAGHDPADLRRIRVEFPSRRLRRLTLVDTPGLASLSTDVSQRTVEFTTSTDVEEGVDAVMYLLRHLHSSDIHFLEAFHGSGTATTSPVNAIGVLSRADEIGAGRTDGLDIARRIAGRYRRDPRVRALVQTVVPVSGLLGQTSSTLREDEHAAVARLAAAPTPVRDRLLLSADHVVAPSAEVAVPTEERAALLSRFGLAGLRLAVALVATGQAPTATALARRLVEHSGLHELQAVLASQFTERRDVIKARRALEAVQAAVAEGDRPGAGRLRARTEEIVAGAHEFRELELLNDLRRGVVAVDDDQRERMEVLLGADGGAVRTRLGLPEDADVATVHDRLVDEHARYRVLSENPIADRRLRRTAATLARTCEHLFAEPELAAR